MAPVLELSHERTLEVVEAGEVVEVRAADGALELRIRLTDEGPVLEMRAVRLVLAAEEAVEIAAPDVEIRAEREMGLHAGGDVVVTGETLWLN